MKEWKARQAAYHMTASLFKDDLTNIETVWRPNTVVEDALKHFTQYVDEILLKRELMIFGSSNKFWAVAEIQC